MNCRTLSSLLLLSFVVLPAVGCRTAGEPSPTQTPRTSEAPSWEDVHSFGRPEQARVTHVSMDLRLDFARQVLEGVVRLDLEVAAGGREVVLDTRGLQVKEVLDADGVALPFSLGEEVPLLGQPLRVSLSAETRSISIRYQTQPSAPALQWLLPAQTLGGERPYLFTQGQAILTRTYIPLQDSPGVRVTYDAQIRVREDLKVVMSAASLVPEGELDGAERIFRFRMSQPIPPYLIALAAGDLAFRSLGPRTGVYAEPALVERAAEEFSDVEKMMDVAQDLYGPYRWERYDILVLPPSFPFGGMENPRLTFLSPTVIAGDRSLVSVVAHELAHSWSGNLVTNANWSEFWLNEGFTSYIELRILEAIYGVQRATLVEALGRRDLLEEIEENASTPEKTALYRPLLEQEDPDDGINSIPYDKGAAFLRMLEHATGRATFDAFLQRYFDANAFSSMTTARFLERAQADLLGGDVARYEALKIQEWAYGTGLPENLPEVTSDRLKELESSAARFGQGAPLESLATDTYGSLDWVLFLRGLTRELRVKEIQALEQRLRPAESENTEIRFEWLKLAVRNAYPVGTLLEEHLIKIGRRRLIVPLYEELVRTESGKKRAREIYARARPGYHPLAVSTVDKIVHEKG